MAALVVLIRFPLVFRFLCRLILFLALCLAGGGGRCFVISRMALGGLRGVLSVR